KNPGRIPGEIVGLDLNLGRAWSPRGPPFLAIVTGSCGIRARRLLFLRLHRCRRWGFHLLLDLLDLASLRAPRGRECQIHLMLPLARPKLARPALQGDGANRRTILVPDHFTPGPCISCAHLGRALAHAQQSLTTWSQACNRSPILSTNRPTTHRLFIL